MVLRVLEVVHVVVVRAVLALMPSKIRDLLAENKDDETSDDKQGQSKNQFHGSASLMM